jgi:uncharacterized LabA/DUF88 family protein
MTEPNVKHAVAFVDGQNLFQHAKAAFGHHHPNYDPKKLHDAVCTANGWKPTLTRFYTGVPEAHEQPMWSGYWSNRVLAMKRAGVHVTTRPLRYRREEIVIDGVTEVRRIAQEKGIDVRLALDIVSLARTKQYDVAIIFSQDQDLNEVIQEVRDISIEQKRWIKVVSAFPHSGSASSVRGINGAQCIDTKDYRPAKT